MKKFLVCLVCATMLCGCGSDKEVFESWKGWVAMKTCSYSLLEEFKKEYANKGDLSSLFYENETSVVYTSGYERVSWTTDDLSVLGSNMEYPEKGGGLNGNDQSDRGAVQELRLLRQVLPHAGSGRGQERQFQGLRVHRAGESGGVHRLLHVRAHLSRRRHRSL